MVAMKFHGPVLPSGETKDLYVLDGRITHEKQPGAESAAQGWIVPGLVDAHCHFGLDDAGAVGVEETETQALQSRDSGALLIRDCGSAADTSWIHDRDDLPRLIRAGRHIARTKRYIRNYADEVEPDGLVEAVTVQAQRGEGWVKLVGDWISRDTGDLEPSFDPDAFAAAIETAHALGAKVTAHCFGAAVLPGLIAAGIDCIEHGTGLSTDLIETMAQRRTALVPTVLQIGKFPEHADAGRAKFPDYAATMDDLYARRRETLMAAHEAGVPMYAGSDGGGSPKYGCLPDEVIAMHELGMSSEAALGAASWRAREWLGRGGLDEGDSSDFVVYPTNPLEDLSVLRSPAAVVLRGNVVA